MAKVVAEFPAQQAAAQSVLNEFQGDFSELLATSRVAHTVGMVWVGMVQPAPIPVRPTPIPTRPTPMADFTHNQTTNSQVSETPQVPVNLYGYFTFFILTWTHSVFCFLVCFFICSITVYL